MKARGRLRLVKPKKYRPTAKEQGLYTLRLIGEPLPLPVSAERRAKEQAAAIAWSLIGDNPNGIKKRNLRGADIGRKPRLSA